jgi:superfamily I DNA/RNA helicase
MARSDRVVFRGPAGTGKTVLAIEECRRAGARAERTLLLCFNALLGDSLRRQTAALPFVQASTLHALMRDVAKLPVPKDPSPEFWRKELPDAAAARLLDDPLPAFDTVIIDEAQDLLRDSYLDVIDLLLDGGLAAGRWRMFGDWERQALYDAADVTLADFLAARAQAAQFDLRMNCRNTPKIARWVSHVALLDPAYTRIRRPDAGPPPRTRYYDTPDAQEQQLTKLLGDLYAEGFEGEDIVVLSFTKEGAASRLRDAPWRDRVKPHHDTGGETGFVRYATVQAFKGLEAPVIVLTDVDEVQGDRATALFYTAITRPTERLYVLAEGYLRDELLDLIERFSIHADDQEDDLD